LPSALAATLTVGLFYLSFAHALGRRAGLLAAALLPCSLLWLGRVPSAEIDLVQLGWVSASLLLFLRALEAAESGAGGRGWWLAALLCVAGGTLTKWTAPAFFYLTIIPLLGWRGHLRLLLGSSHLCALALALALCAGWAAAAAAEVGAGPLRETVLREALQRLSPQHHPRPYPWLELLTFPGSFLLACLPGAALAPVACRPSFGRLLDERGRCLWQLLLCWAAVNLLFWAVVPGHRPRHALPLQPALAGLSALAAITWLRGTRKAPEGERRGVSPPVGRGRPALKGRAYTSGSRVNPAEAVAPAQPGSPGFTRGGPSFTAGWCAAPPAGSRRAARQAARIALVGLLVAWLAVKMGYTFVVVPRQSAHRHPSAGGALLSAAVPPGGLLYLVNARADGVLFYYGRRTCRLDSPGQLPAGACCLLTEPEWRRWPAGRGARERARLEDDQGGGLVLIEAPAEGAP
jgi:4-amino-4-deoxy-L-arabinose transferase-like glycosyltransferase